SDQDEARRRRPALWIHAQAQHLSDFRDWPCRDVLRLRRSATGAIALRGKISRRVNLLGPGRLEDAKRTVEAHRIIRVDRDQNRAVVKPLFQAWCIMLRNPDMGQSAT